MASLIGIQICIYARRFTYIVLVISDVVTSDESVIEIKIHSSSVCSTVDVFFLFQIAFPEWGMACTISCRTHIIIYCCLFICLTLSFESTYIPWYLPFITQKGIKRRVTEEQKNSTSTESTV